jgi:DNA repair protein RecO (recombination protein O)
MEWREPGVILGARRHGESSLIISILTRTRGRNKGLARGAARAGGRGAMEPGTLVDATWSARLQDHLGHWRIEPGTAYAAMFLDDPLRLACLEATTDLADAVLPERQPFPPVHDGMLTLLDALGWDEGWAPLHLRWELDLLAALGYGLDLASCAVTGGSDDLAYVSPRTGRAVSADAGAAYRDRLLVLPRLLGGTGRAADWSPTRDLLDGLALTGHFLARHAPGDAAAPLPGSRMRYIDRVTRLMASSGQRLQQD